MTVVDNVLALLFQRVEDRVLAGLESIPDR